MKKLLAVFLLSTTTLFAQSMQQKRISIEYAGTFEPRSTNPGVISFLYPTGAPVPGGEGTRAS